MLIKDRAADWTLAVVLPVTEPEVADIVTEPRARAVARPLPVIDSTLLFDEAQVTEAVMSCTLVSENVPVAVNCWWVPTDKKPAAGVISIETKVTFVAVTVRVAVEETFAELAEIMERPGERPLTRPAISPTLMVAAATFPEIQLTEDVISR